MLFKLGQAAACICLLGRVYGLDADCPDGQKIIELQPVTIVSVVNQLESVVSETTLTRYDNRTVH